MKVAMIGLRGIPALSGGVEHVVEKLAPLLVSKGVDLTVYCRKPYMKKKMVEWVGVKLRTLPALNTKHLETISHSTLATFDAAFRNYDIVHFHAMGNGIFSLIPRLTFKKTLVTLHGLDYERQKWGLAAKLFLRVSERAITMLPNRIVSCSKKIRRHYLEEYGSEVDFIPNGVEIIKPLELSSMAKYGLEKGKYILFLSRIVPEKGLHYLIDAFRRTETDMKLAVVGDATHTDKYLKDCKVRARGDKRIVFTGPKYGKDKYELFSNAYCFVLPSTIEGMPIVMLESMSFGICPLVSDIRENLDVLEGLGFSFKVKSPTDLKRKLEYMLANPKKVDAQAKKCQALVKKEYQWGAIADSYYELYEEMLK